MSPAAGKPVLYLSLIISPLVQETILVGKAVLNNNLCYFVSQTTKGVVISETKAQLIIKQILRGLVTYNVYHNRKEDRLCIILHG